ncbi:Histone methyltransferase [Mycena venus]|uniref:Histone-lysine N-methyltransferase, H3 lysine-36 specific n=1 Tax=Mycena venus TaxID=2733690 RepID=A0A8H6U0K8_9AGAR|nr:Histone methyltransferase [Mycena venus]
MPSWPAKEESTLSAPSAPAECSSDLPSPPMAPEPQDEAKTPTSRSPSAPASMNGHVEDVDIPVESLFTTSEADESLPPEDDDSPSGSASPKGSRSPSSTPPPLSARTPSAGTKKKSTPPLQLIGDLPIARTDALATFNEISDNNYQNKSIGRSREAMEGMTCECIYRKGKDQPTAACGEGSNCINRLTQIECLPDDCRCKSSCQNQRFQRKQYGPIDIVLTEKKGFGLRAEDDIQRDAFIYEYIGDVVNPTAFKKRMRDYADEGIRHFYFMMLQKDEFIDATKSGGIGRFANHSCNPNCYVAKWTVGEHVRMGIFAKRNIQKHEELTFNYNVDRYGHKAQQCFCGEPNCVGFIGGKTQTDIATVDDLYLDALGITDENERMALKGTKKKKGKKLDDADFLPELRPITVKELPKIMQALRQTQAREVVVKLLTRFRLTNDESTMREMLRLRCMSLMKNVLDDNASDLEIFGLVLESIRPWPLTNRNKVEDCAIDTSIRAITESEDEKLDEKLKSLAQSLIDHWLTLPLAYRIPKRVIVPKDEEEEEKPAGPVYDDYGYRKQLPPPPPPPPRPPSILKRPRLSYDQDYPRITPDMPNVPPMPRYIPPPFLDRKPKPAPEPKPVVKEGPDYETQLAAIIAEAVAKKAAEDAAAAEAAAAAAAAAEAAKKAPREHKRKHRSHKKAQTPEEKEANKEKRLLKLVGAVVVKCMSKYGKSLDRDTFKKHAKELTQLIAEKEKKSGSYKENKLEALSDEKVAKIKKFSKEYIAKVVRKMEKSGHKHRPPSSSTTQETPSRSAVDTPNSIDGVDTVMTEMTVEEAMDMDPASESEGEEEGGGDGDGDGDVDMEVDEEAGGDMRPPAASTDGAPVMGEVIPLSGQAPTGGDPRRRLQDDPWDPAEKDPWDSPAPTGKLNGVSVA